MKPATPIRSGQPERVISTRPPASAWELGHGRQIAGTWPPAFTGGRQYAPLGPWVDPHDNNRSAA